MKIGILGAGAVGMAIGKGLCEKGYEVMMGSNHVQKPSLQDFQATFPGKGFLGSLQETAVWGDLIVLCTTWQSAQLSIEQAGVWNFKSKIVVDVTNPLDDKGPDANGKISFQLHKNLSAGEQIQAWLPGAHVVKALNSIGHGHMINPQFKEGAPSMFICGNNDWAKKAVKDILQQLGWPDVIDIGGIEIAREIEALSVLWWAYGFRTGTWHHAFRLLRE
ncbi:hypothetical protein LX64_04952 [Chitinophaga skermanii]|uniref:Pyrroline-5-carboxylate reductase catalytic N-terminal domain-containing protein n=1 Tax=Chitinophaga skermanii TaxID=331697 RepID=A0A327Q3Z9_9BACT|nr:NAD(P)-binding domain-containing protein [Chitinophaga skermanii]RAI97902.1 hypothetical protein LX64_04952 [Chitinophaga skermanii]